MVGMNGPTVLFLCTILWRTSTGHNREVFYLMALWIVKIIYSVDCRWMKCKYVYGAIRENQTTGMKTCPSITLFTYPTTNSLWSNPRPQRRQGLRLTSSASENDYTYIETKERGPANVSSPRLSQALQLPLSAYYCIPLHPYGLFVHKNAGTDNHMMAFTWDGEVLSEGSVRVCNRHREGGWSTVKTTIHGLLTVASAQPLHLYKNYSAEARTTTQTVAVISNVTQDKYSKPYRCTNLNHNHCQQQLEQLRSAHQMVTHFRHIS